MWDKATSVLDWFIPRAAHAELSDLGRARNFVFLHLSGPTLSQSIGVFLFLADPSPGWAFWTIELCICAFWALPFVLRRTGDLQLTAFMSVQLLTFVTLFGSYFYGGVSSPFLPWLLVAAMLGFFYLSEHPLLVVGCLLLQLLGFFIAYLMHGSTFPLRVSLEDLSGVGLISVFSATVYMSWMAMYYANMMTQRSVLEREVEHHRETGVRLRQAMDFAQRANHAKSVFVAKMSHELRTPLNAVIGYSELLVEEPAFSHKDPQRVTDLKRIITAGRHLLALVTDVLDLSEIESYAQDLRSETLDVDSFIEDVVATALPLVRENGNRLEVIRQPGLGAIETDPMKLRQSLLNLLSNAAKFTTGGVITVVARRDRKASGDWIEFEVRDTGIGMSKDEIGKLFRDFGQATSATSKIYGGTGLGLSLTNRFCALMGGAVTVRSAVGAGSAFTIRIPAKLDLDETHKASAAEPPRLAATFG